MVVRILHADDEAFILSLSSSVLGSEGYEVLQAHDGQEAVDIARKGGLDLILMDMKMPNKDGMSAIEEIRNFSKNIPIVIISAYIAAELKQKASNFNCAYLLKPYRCEELVGTVKQILERNSPNPAPVEFS